LEVPDPGRGSERPFPGSDRSRGGGFTSTPRAGALSRGFWKRGVGAPGGGSWSEALTGPRRENRASETSRTRDGDRAPPRGVDVKPPPRRRPRPGIPGIPGSGVLGPAPGAGGNRLGAFPARGPGTRGPGRSQDPGSRISEVREDSRGLPRPRGRGPEGLFYINPSRRGPVATERSPSRERVGPNRPSSGAWDRALWPRSTVG